MLTLTLKDNYRIFAKLISRSNNDTIAAEQGIYNHFRYKCIVLNKFWIIIQIAGNFLKCKIIIEILTLTIKDNYRIVAKLISRSNNDTIAAEQGI